MSIHEFDWSTIQKKKKSLINHQQKLFDGCYGLFMPTSQILWICYFLFLDISLLVLFASHLMHMNDIWKWICRLVSSTWDMLQIQRLYGAGLSLMSKMMRYLSTYLSCLVMYISFLFLGARVGAKQRENNRVNTQESMNCYWDCFFSFLFFKRYYMVSLMNIYLIYWTKCKCNIFFFEMVVTSNFCNY